MFSDVTMAIRASGPKSNSAVIIAVVEAAQPLPAKRGPYKKEDDIR